VGDGHGRECQSRNAGGDDEKLFQDPSFRPTAANATSLNGNQSVIRSSRTAFYAICGLSEAVAGDK